MSYAFEKGRHRDDEWVAEFAATRLKGRALRWYTDLDDSTTGSWKAPRRALLERWSSSSDEDVEESATIPQPAAAGIPTPAARAPALLRLFDPRPWDDDEVEPHRPLVGHLRALIEGSDVISYVRWNLDKGVVRLVRDVDEAAMVKIDPLKEYQEIILVDTPVYTTCCLAGFWEFEWPPYDDGSGLMVGMLQSGSHLMPDPSCGPEYLKSDLFSVNEDGIFDVALKINDTDTTRRPVQIYQPVALPRAPIGASTLHVTLDYQVTTQQKRLSMPNVQFRKVTLKFEPLYNR